MTAEHPRPSDAETLGYFFGEDAVVVVSFLGPHVGCVSWGADAAQAALASQCAAGVVEMVRKNLLPRPGRQPAPAKAAAQKGDG